MKRGIKAGTFLGAKFVVEEGRVRVLAAAEDDSVTVTVVNKVVLSFLCGLFERAWWGDYILWLDQ